MTDTRHSNHNTETPANMPAEPSTSHSAPVGHNMNSRMMWVMMIGCCLAIPLALILGGAGLAGLAGASPWLIGAAVVLAVALLVTHRVSRGPSCDDPPDHDE